MAKMGRPRLENPRSERIFIRLTKDEHTDVREYAANHNLTITQIFVQGFKSCVSRRMRNRTGKWHCGFFLR